MAVLRRPLRSLPLQPSENNVNGLQIDLPVRPVVGLARAGFPSTRTHFSGAPDGDGDGLDTTTMTRDPIPTALPRTLQNNAPRWQRTNLTCFIQHSRTRSVRAASDNSSPISSPAPAILEDEACVKGRKVAVNVHASELK